MALYAIGDLHLSLNSNKSMEVFGPAWENYTERIQASLSQLTAEDVLVCGTRGWFLEEEQKPHNAKVLNRELLRLETSLKAAGEKPIFCFLHYPPLYQGYQCPEILSLLETYKVELCCYGHLHGPVIRRRQEGKYGNTEFYLISGDYLGFVPKKICEK